MHEARSFRMKREVDEVSWYRCCGASDADHLWRPNAADRVSEPYSPSSFALSRPFFSGCLMRACTND